MGKDPLDDPRVTLHIEDARTLLAHGAGEYGVVISEPSNPWIAGVNNLFTVDFYRRARARLSEDGVFCQWLQLYELSPSTFRSLLASFLEVFPTPTCSCCRNPPTVARGGTAGPHALARPVHSPSLDYSYERALLTAPEQIAAF